MARIRINHARTPILTARDNAIRTLIRIRRKVTQAMIAADEANRPYCVCFPESIGATTGVYQLPQPVAMDADDARQVATYGPNYEYDSGGYFMPEELDFPSEEEQGWAIMAFRRGMAS